MLLEIDYFGQSGYHWAAKRGYIPCLNVLTGNGKHVNLLDKKHRTPLFLAAKANYLKACEILLNNGANPFLRNNQDKLPIDITTNPLIKRELFERMEVKYFINYILT